MVDGRELHEIIKNVFDDVKGLYKSSQLQVNCPKCAERDGGVVDYKYNLEISTSLNRRVFKCWKCEPQFSGTLGSLIRMYGSYIDYELYKSLAGKYSDYTPSEDEGDFLPVFLPGNFILFSDMDENNSEHMEAYKYMILERKIPFDKLLDFRIGFCTEGKYAKRIIIPSYDINGNVDYFVGRSYYKSKKPYDNPKHNKKNLIFNEKFINYDSLIFLVEGVFEMLTLPNAIPLLGKQITERLYFKLKERRPNIIVALDPDAKKDEFEIYNLLKNAYGNDSNRVRVLGLKGDLDIDELNKKLGKESVIDSLYFSKELKDNDYFNLYINK